MKNLGALVLRLTVGSLLAGHGAQKLLGWFGGYGLQGTGNWLESMGLRPGKTWATVAAASELGGAMMALGFLNPLGEVGVIGAMAMATAKVHWGKPIWVTSGGPELPLTNVAVAMAMILDGPGKYSLDELLGTRLPRWIAVPALCIAACAVAFGLQTSRTEELPEEVAGGELQAGVEAAHPA